MINIKEIRKCVICDKQLNTKQKNCCSFACRSKLIAKNVKIINCEICGKEITCSNFSTRKYCSIKCYEKAQGQRTEKAKTRPDPELDRPYTSETAHIIRMWHKSGDSLENIALALGRSLENVKLAFM